MGFVPSSTAAAASHWELPVARELLVTRELPSSCVVTNVPGTGARGRKGDDAGYLCSPGVGSKPRSDDG